MKFNFLFYTFLLTFSLFSSCKKSTNTDPSVGLTNLASVNISGATSLFISSSNSESKLYGIGSKPLSMRSIGSKPLAMRSKATSEDENQVYEIKYFDSEGEEIIVSNPTHVFNLKKIVVLIFNDRQAYFVKKSDGKVFEIPSEYTPHFVANKYNHLSQYLNTIDKIQEDSHDNMYYITYQTSSPHKKTLYKVSISNASSLQFQEVSAVNDDVNGFCVDINGNIHYGFSDKNTSTYKYRYRINEGNFITPNFPKSQYNNRIWIGTDGQMYGLEINDKDNSNKFNASIGEIQNGKFRKNKLVEMNLNDWGFGNVFNVNGNIFYTYEQYNPGKLFNISTEQKFQILYPSVVANYVFNDNLYNFNKESFSFTRINTEDGSTSLVFDLDKSVLGNYDVDKILGVTNDDVTFSAVDLSNGQYIIARINRNNFVEILEYISGEIKTLVTID